MSGKGQARYKPYSAYKPSRVEWLGDIPEGWDALRVKLAADFRNDKRRAKESDAYVGLENVVPWVGEHTSTIEQDVDGLSLAFKNGDILFGKLRPYLAKSWRANFDGVCSSEFLVMASQYLEPKFLNYVTLTADFINQVDGSTYGSKMPRANSEFIGQLKIPHPTAVEATKIAAFLDHETMKIDALIAKQQRLIELLEEKRQAVISHAVTKGLNPNAPMRPSGIDWLGDIPAHWATRKLNLLVSTRKGIAFKADDFCDSGVAVAKASDIKNLTFNTSQVFLPQKFVRAYPKAILKEGNIVLSTVGSNPDVINSAVGQIGRVPKNQTGSLLNQNTVVFDVDGAAIGEEFVFAVLQTRGYRDHLDLNAHGTANQSSLNVADMLDFVVPLPDEIEQTEISKHLQQNSVVIQRLKAASQTAITLLKERRTALISAAVTGKIDVRDWQPPKHTENNTIEIT